MNKEEKENMNGMNEKTINTVGWIGVGMILLAYAAVSFDQVQPNSWLYQLLNLIGSIFIIAQTWHKKDYQPMTLNVVWAIIALLGIIGLFTK